MQGNRHVVYIAAAVVFAVLALAAFVVVRLGPGNPAAVATVLVALAALLGAVAPILHALRGR